MPLTNLKIYLYITGIISFVVYVSGLAFLSFGIMFSQKTNHEYIYPNSNTSWLIDKPVDYLYWIFMYIINTLIGGINMGHFYTNSLSFSNILFMFLSNIIAYSFLMGIYLVFLTWPVIVFFSIIYLIICISIYKTLIILHTKKYANAQTTHELGTINSFENQMITAKPVSNTTYDSEC